MKTSVLGGAPPELLRSLIPSEAVLKTSVLGEWLRYWLRFAQEPSEAVLKTSVLGRNRFGVLIINNLSSLLRARIECA